MENNQEEILTTNWTRNLLLAMIKNDLDNFTIKVLPVIKDKEKKTNTFTYVFTLEKESYEYIE